jgi:cis-3-alkyl-4-acyloxetan-2-one decarboxylase
VKLPSWIEAQLPPGSRHHLLDVGGERMHVAEWGPADGHAIVLVHGNPTWGFLWRKVIAAIQQQPEGRALRLVVPDLIGLGLSSKPAASAHSVVAHGGWLGSALDALVPGPLVLAVQDWGAPIALTAMAKRRARLRGLVIGNTSVSPPREGFKPTLFHRLSQLPVVSNALFRYLGFPLGVLHLSQGDRSSIRGEVARAYRWPLAQRSDRAAPLALARLVPDSLAHPSVPALRETDELYRSIEVPIAIVWGERDPILGRVLGHLTRLRPDATVTRTQAGHFLQEEVPDELAAAIVDVAGRAEWS